MPRTGLKWRVRAHVTRSEFFPKLDQGFWADLTSGTEQLRLLVHIDNMKWVTSVYNKRTKEWLAESSAAKDSEDAKRKAEQIASTLFSGKDHVEWHKIGGGRS